MMRVTATARGRVQGVGYRYYLTDCARETGITGFVRNEPDGSVMIVAEGSREDAARFICMAKAEKDPFICVESLEVVESSATGEFRQFSIRW